MTSIPLSCHFCSESLLLQRAPHLRASALQRTGSGPLALPASLAAAPFLSPPKPSGSSLVRPQSLSLEETIALQRLQAASAKLISQGHNNAAVNEGMSGALKSAFASSSAAATAAGGQTIQQQQQLLMHQAQVQQIDLRPAKRALQRSGTVHNMSDGEIEVFFALTYW